MIRPLSRMLNILLRVKNYLSKIPWLIRRFFLNNQCGIHVSCTAFVDKTVKFKTEYKGQISISANAQIMEGVILAPYGGSITIEENVFIGPYCVIYGHGGLTVGKDTMIATHTVIIPANHGFEDMDVPIRKQQVTQLGITIGEDVWIGCGARILDGVTVGRGSVVGAGTVVSKSLGDYSVVAGIPAKTLYRRG